MLLVKAFSAVDVIKIKNFTKTIGAQVTNYAKDNIPRLICMWMKISASERVYVGWFEWFNRTKT